MTPGGRVRGAVRRRLPWARPALSVVVATLDSADHLDECLRTLRHQQVPDVEILVVDLGSTDGTLALVERHRAEDRRIRLLHTAGALGAARNHGAAAARGQFLTFVDPEDGVTPHGPARAIEALRSSGADHAVTAARPWRRGHERALPDAMRRQHDVRREGVVALPSAGRVVHRRESYVRSGLAFDDLRRVDATHAAAAALAGRGVWLDHIGSLRTPDADRSPLTAAPDPATAVAEIAADVRRALGLLPEGDRAVAAARALADDLADHLRLAWQRDGAYWSALVEQVGPIIEVAAPAVAVEMSAYDTALASFVRSDDRDGALHFLADVRPTARQYPVELTAARPVVDFGDVTAALGDVDLLVRGAVTSIRADGDLLTLTGWAFVDNIDLAGRSATLALDLVAADGTTLSLDVEQHDSPDADVASGLHHADVTPSGFTATLSSRLSTLTVVGPWRLRASIEVTGLSGLTGLAGVPSRGWLDVQPWVVAGTAAWADGGDVWFADADDMGRLELRCRRPAASLRGARTDGGSLELDLDARSVTLRGPGGGVALRRSGGRFTVPLDRLAHGGPWIVETGGVRTGRIVEPGRRAVARPAGVALPPLLTTDRRGRVVARPPARAAVVLSAALGGEALLADIEVLPDAPTGWRVALVDGRSAAEGTVEAVRPGLLRVRVPLTATAWGHEACLRTGRHALSLANDHHPDWFVPPASPDLVRTLPLAELQERMRLRVEVFGPDLGGVRVDVAPPLADDELGERQQRLLRESARVEVADRPAVFLRAMFGEYANGNALGLHEELVRSGSRLELLWSVADRSVAVPPGGVGLVERSRAWHDAIARARYHLVDVHQVRWFERPEGQVLIETFHGYPYKLMGQDWWEKMGNDPAEVGSLHRRTRDWSALVSPAGYASPLLRDAFLAPADALDVPVLEVGYPRNDVLQRPEAADLRRTTREQLGIAEGARVVLYAPTFRDYLSADDLTARRVTFFDPAEALAALPDDYVVLVRGHAFNARMHDDRLGADDRIIDVTDHPDPNLLMLASDVGILDYSSMRFDYALTGRPMVFLVPDVEQYHRFRGGVIPYAPTAPGPHVDTTAEAVTWLADLPRLTEQYAAAREQFRADYTELDDGHAAERLVAALFAPRGDA